MDEETLTKYDILYSKINERLNAEFVDKTEDELSLFELVEILKKEFRIYNKLCTCTDAKNTYKKLRRSNNLLFSEKVPMIFEAYPTIKDNIPFVTIVFTDKDNKYKGSATIGNYEQIECDLTDGRYSVDKTIELLSLSDFDVYVSSLSTFNERHPNVDFEWNSSNNENMTQTISDGFIACKIDLSDLEKTHVFLANLEDTVLSTVRSSKYGQLNDFIEMYNNGIMLRTKVNVEELNPLFKTIVKNCLKNEKEMTLRKNKK